MNIFISRFIRSIVSLSLLFISFPCVYASVLGAKGIDLSITNHTQVVMSNFSYIDDGKGWIEDVLSPSTLIEPNGTNNLAKITFNFWGSADKKLSFDLIDEHQIAIAHCDLHVIRTKFLRDPIWKDSICKSYNVDNNTNDSYKLQNINIYVELSYDNNLSRYQIKFHISNKIEFHRIFVFGDSLSDIGNAYKYTFGSIPKSPPYYKGHFSNYKIWIEYLADILNIPENSLIDYAFGGAKVIYDGEGFPSPSLKDQIETYLSFNDFIDPSALYVVWGGSNDIINHNFHADNMDKMHNIIYVLQTEIEKLITRGAKYFIIPSVADLGKNPQTWNLHDPNISYNNSEKSKIYNQLLREMIFNLEQKYSQIKIISFDILPLLNSALSNPQKFGFNVVYKPCNPYWVTSYGDEICNNPDDYIFFDELHPTTKIHRLFAEKISQYLQEQGFVLSHTNKNKINILSYPINDTNQNDEVYNRNKLAIASLYSKNKQQSYEDYAQSIFVNKN